MNLLQDVVHLQQFGLDEGTVGSTDVTYVVQAQVVEDQNVPVIPLEGAVQVTGHVVVNLGRGNGAEQAYALTNPGGIQLIPN